MIMIIIIIIFILIVIIINMVTLTASAHQLPRSPASGRLDSTDVALLETHSS